MPRHSTAPPAPRRPRRLRFDGRCTKSHCQLAAARVKDRVLTLALDPCGRRAPFTFRFALPCSHLPYLISTIVLPIPASRRLILTTNAEGPFPQAVALFLQRRVLPGPIVT